MRFTAKFPDFVTFSTTPSKKGSLVDAINRCLVTLQYLVNPPKRDERGGGPSVEHLGWIGIAVGVLAIVGVAIYAYIRTKLPQ